jgi:putative ABC transport system permease protein
VTTIADQLNSFLGTNHNKSVVIEKIRGLINNIVYIVDGIASIVFLVGILDIINTMGFNLNERKREIVILKTLGFSKIQLLTSLSIEAGLIGLLGSIGGALIASIGLIVVANIIGISISILIPPGILPAWFAVERNITEVLV